MDVFLGMVFPWAVPWVPYGFASCNGALLPINQNQALFALLGTTYGGNGTTNFAIPNLQGRVVLGQGPGPTNVTYVPGQMDGTPSVTLLSSNLPPHIHPLGSAATITGGMQASHKAGTQTDPTGNYMANAANPAGGELNTYIDPTSAGTSLVQMAGGGLTLGGTTGASTGGTPVGIMPPYTCMYYIIATQGIFPTRA